LQIAPEEDDWKNIETHSYTVEEDTGRLIPFDTSELRTKAQKNTKNEKNDCKLTFDSLGLEHLGLEEFLINDAQPDEYQRYPIMHSFPKWRKLFDGLWI
jgi:hypothetical protein